MKTSYVCILILGICLTLTGCNSRKPLEVGELIKRDLSSEEEQSSEAPSRTPYISSKDLFVCSEGQDPAPALLKRLTSYELLNTYRDLFGSYLMTDMKPKVDLFPQENVFLSFDNIDRAISTDLIDGFVEFNYQLSGRVSSNSKYMGLIDASCFLNTSVTSNCIKYFITKFGKKVYRRPLEATEISRLEQIYLKNATTAKDGFKTLLTAMLSSPHFFYRLETRGSELANKAGVLSLTSYEVASRLSYLFWGSLPDEELMLAADKNTLLSQEELKKQIGRLIASPRAKTHIRHFYEQWLDLNNPIPSAYSAAFLEGIQVRKIVGESQREVDEFLNYIFWDKKGNMNDLLLDRRSFARNGTLAGFYNVPLWADGQEPVELDSLTRAGILTRMNMLANGEDTTHPFRRGSLILTRFQCRSPARPQAENLPDGALAEPPIDGTLSTRHRFEHKTNHALCMSCHAQLNPLSFAMESYDSIGRFRTEEKIYSGGVLIGGANIDAVVTYDYPDRSERIDGPVELSRALASDVRTHECAARQWYRFGIGQVESPADGCLLKSLFNAIAAEKGSFVEMFKTTALHPNFLLRKVGAQ